ncbi:response regulator [Roseateles saccharophilus]|uniref:Two-component system cell cycle response regulator DivK n=1 Tax=Roseateles saccharophilus TaxID=304 RepID=A0A4R3V0K3_ROSSA|nr:response regulator [Roseateles saccharophilus]MDG0832346.1 response regulator [Roseateles saccharophilus]TCU97040.1 two-component system cell cycle response regulator DivK [Roseateles saccharophilus]
MSLARALVVDDHQLNLDLARYVLEADGFIVDEALHADAAWASLRACRPDVVLVDIQLPGTDGLTLVRAIKATPGLADIPCIAFTAYAMQGDEQRFRAAGCDGYLVKPIDVRSFAACVRSHLAN